MKRPLLFFSFCLTALIAVWYWRADASAGGGPPDGTGLMITGQVRQKDETSFIIQVQKAAVLRQENPYNYFSNNSNHDFHNDSACEAADSLSECRERGILCEYDRAEELILGSVVTVRGEFRAFETAGNPGEFDYARYYRALGYAGRLHNTVLVAQETCAPGVRESLYRLRCFWEERLYRIFPEREASVMAAILLGDKSGVDEEVKELYQKNGIVHILSISGLHITLIGMGLYRLLRRMGVRVGAASAAGGVVLVLYGIMTGFGVSVCRAIGMYLIRMFAQMVGRTYDMLTALGVVAVLMALYRPAWLGHMGFLLSFGSVLGVGALLPALTKRAGDKPPEPKRYVEGKWRQRLLKEKELLWDGLRQGLLASLSVTLTTLPIQLWFTYEIPVYAVLLNVLILPLMSVLMVAGLTAMLIPGLGIAGMVDMAILAGYEGLCRLFDRLPCGTWNPGRPDVRQIAVYYLLWAAAVWGVEPVGRGIRSLMRREMPGAAKRKASGRAKGETVGRPRREVPARFPKGGRRISTAGPIRLLLLGLAVFAIGFSPWKGDRVTFLDVGQGDCICVQLSSGEVYLFDCGSSSRSHIGERVLIPFLQYYGIRKVDAVFASHADLDHVNGITELLEQCGEEGIAVGQLVLPGIEPTLWQEEFGELLAAAEGAGGEIPVRLIRAGESWHIGEDAFLCLHPSASGQSEGGNAGSECFYIELREGRNQISLLLAGDVEGAGETALLEELRSRDIRLVTVLKVAHHGSRNSTSTELLAQLRPGLAVVSCGQNNRYGHPHAELLKRLEDCGTETLITYETGAVTFRIDAEKVEYRFSHPYAADEVRK